MRFKLFSGLEPLSASVSKMLSKVTVVGVKEAFSRLVQVSNQPLGEQQLYLVADTNNRLDPDAVMLHDGVNKLGRVVTKDACVIREFLDNASLDRGQDQVIVVSLAPLVLPEGVNGRSVWASSVCVAGLGLVYERVARKHAQHKPL